MRLLLFVGRAYWVVCFFPFFNNIAIKLHSQLTDVTTSTLSAANCHWQNCRIRQNMHPQPPWPFISLITRGIQWRILGRYFQCSDLLQIRLEESFPGSLDTEGGREDFVWIFYGHYIDNKDSVKHIYLLNWNPSGNLYWIVLCLGCQIRNYYIRYLPSFSIQVDSENLEKCARADVSDTEVNKYSNKCTQ